ncbi:sensor domain-containing diguanylate cyclase [Massilia scottii]|uniref:sensor domain-containing diguanylate cyclase n=1 Tax=Massilia scottii TaxID=3057166 RepID=UPI0027967685|nr:sensor domain-containing diguanylate cyclase [Massilia sp. CCM 9029]MDQ1829129.1 sensor domain-containing diguanylate cyclase [Massilia sp. CCM 9029]
MNPAQAPYHFQTALQPLLLQAFTQLANAVFITDTAGRIEWANHAFCALSGYEFDELLGRTPSLLSSGSEGPVFYAELWQKVLSGRVWHGQVIDKRKDGTLYAADETITPLRNEDGAISHFVAVQQDITQQLALDNTTRSKGRLEIWSRYPNRAAFLDLLSAAMSRASRSTAHTAVVRIALDGHPDLHGQLSVTGNTLLCAAADRLSNTVRQSDTLAHVGDAEFAILATGIDNRDIALALANKLQAALAAPFVVRGNRIVLQASIGIAMSPEDGAEAGALLCNADHALYQATLQGTNRCQFFERSFAHGPGGQLVSARTAQ